MIFETSLITNPRYKKYKIIRGVFYLALLVFGVPAFFLVESSSNRRSLSEDLNEFPLLMYYFLILTVIGIFYGIIHYYSWRIKIIGQLKLDMNGLVILVEGDKKQISFQDIETIKITRSSTFHKGDDNGFSKPYKGNNWIELKLDNENLIKYEFMIKSEDHNDAFERMVKDLKIKLRQKFLFFSI